MRGYELCLIFHPDAGEDTIATILQNLNEQIKKHKGTVTNTEKWGKKFLKYTIKKQTKGIYYFLSYMGTSAILNEIDRLVKFNESILRYSTVRLDEDEAARRSEQANRTPAEEPEEISNPVTEEETAVQPKTTE